MGNKYVVKISYMEFHFTDRIEALDFAETAFNTVVGENRYVDVKIVKDEAECQEVEE